MNRNRNRKRLPLHHFARIPTPDLAVARIVVEAVARVFAVPVAEILGKRRFRTIAHARHAAVYLLRARLGWSYPQLGGYFDHADHTSSMHSTRWALATLLRARDPRRLKTTCLDDNFFERLHLILTQLDAPGCTDAHAEHASPSP
jgi:hypothetical protein